MKTLLEEKNKRPENLNRYFSKEDIEMSMVNRYEKMLNTAYHQGNVNKNLTPVRTTIIKKNRNDKC